MKTIFQTGKPSLKGSKSIVILLSQFFSNWCHNFYDNFNINAPVGVGNFLGVSAQGVPVFVMCVVCGTCLPRNFFGRCFSLLGLRQHRFFDGPSVFDVPLKRDKTFDIKPTFFPFQPIMITKCIFY